MTEAVLVRPHLSPSLADKALKGAATFWFAVAAVGHWIFVVYVLGFYGPILVQGIDALSQTHLPNGFVEGDSLGNAAVAAHLVLAVIIIGGGPLQLIPQIRARFPSFHRWLGRCYLLAAVTSSIAGLYMVWTRGTIGNMINHLGISLDGILILVFAVLAVRYAIARDIRRHRRWAMRLFLVASGVWFFRVGLMGWTVITGGAGIDFETFTGPFIYIWGFGQYLLPLAVLELYFRAKDGGSANARLAMASGLIVLTLAMGVGIFAASMGMWLPRL